MDEEWRVVPGFAPYEASSLGQVRNGKTGRILKLDICKGYARVAPCFNNKATHQNVSRLVCLAFHGFPPEGKPDCRHLDGVKLNNRKENVAWGSKSDNEQDKKDHGTYQIGSGNPFSRLTETQVLEIRKRRTDHLEQRKIINKVNTEIGFIPSLAKEYGVSESCIKLAIGRINWKHI